MTDPGSAASPATGNSGVAPLLVLGKITDILDSFTLESPSLSLAEIRSRTGLPTSTTQRLVTNLVAQGFLDRDDDRFRIGLKMAYWSAPAVRGIKAIDLLAPLLRELRQATGESATLFRADDDYRVCIAVDETRHELKQDVHVGKVAPLTVGSAGRVLLAWNDDLRESILARPIPDLAASTITDPAELRGVLDQTRRDGFAITRNERIDGLVGLAAPVFEPSGRVRMAMGVSGPAARIKPHMLEEWAPMLVETAERATRLIGGRAPATD